MSSQRTAPWVFVLAGACALLAPVAFLLLPLAFVLGGVPITVALLAWTNGERRPAVVLGGLTLLAGLPVLVALKSYQVPSESMAPSVQIGDRVVVSRGGGGAAVGDIVILHPPVAATGGSEESCGAPQPRGAACAKARPGDSEENFIKRVVAVGGDRIAIVGERVQRNGVLQPEPFVTVRCEAGADSSFPTEITVPPGTVYVLGDNRQCSEDSRFWGPVRRGAITGIVRARVRPLSRLGGV